MKNAVFGKIMKNVRKQKKRNYLVSETNYYTTRFFTEYLLAIEMRKRKCFWVNHSVLEFQY